MTNEEKAKEIAENNKCDYPFKGGLINTSKAECEDSALEMAEWKDDNPSDEMIKKICKLCDKFDKDAPWQSAVWCENAEDDDWEYAKHKRVNFIKKHWND